MKADPELTNNGQNEVAVKLENITVRYILHRQLTKSVKQYVVNALRKKYTTREVLALKGVSFEIPKGTVFGIVGRNGAGKSTLLRVITRIIRPTEGRIVLHGKVAALMGIGAGFHLELSGRENVYLYAAILGQTKREIDDRFEKIIDFAELHQFIDMPLRAYSSGMRSRLGFAVATEVDPDILVIDEALAAGDAAFREKSFERMDSFRKRGVTILLVSHNNAQIKQICQQAAWLNQGELEFIGPAEETVAKYEEYLKTQTPQNKIPHKQPKLSLSK